jgi:S-ribosylhomocysteine lyase LuxS involved in autoinducer biosynthesis
MSKPLTLKQKQQVRTMFNTLKKIVKEYQTADQIVRNSEKQCGLDPQEALEMSYENIQAEAKQAIKSVSISKLLEE